MRIRITRPLSGSIDGIQLRGFKPGSVYDVGTSIGSYLLSVGDAEPVADESPVLVVPLNHPDFPIFGATADTPRAEAADRRPRSKKSTPPPK